MLLFQEVFDSVLEKSYCHEKEQALINENGICDVSFVKKFLPPNPKGHILLTSRAPVFHSLKIIKLVKIKEMSPHEAKSFLLKRTGRANLDQSELDIKLDQSELDQSELEALDKLVHELGCLPLALEQAGAYIYVNNSSFKDYSASYKIRGLKLLEKSHIDKNEYPESDIYHMVDELRGGEEKFRSIRRYFICKCFSESP